MLQLTRYWETNVTTDDVPTSAELAASLDGDFRSEHADVNGFPLHYVTGGAGAPLVLLPGWPETWWEYRKVMPSLADSFKVVVCDLPGMGDSAKAERNYSKKAMAGDIRALVRHLGYDEVNIAGHGIGGMVAFAYAANFADATTKVAILQTTHADDSYLAFPMLPSRDDPPPHRWWLAFNQVEGFPEQVLAGRYRLMIDYMFGLSLVNPEAITDFDRAVYATAYDSPGAVRACQGWFQAYLEDIDDLRSYGKVSVPMLGLAYGPFFDYMKQVLPDQGVDVQLGEITDSRNYLVEEQPGAVTEALTTFFL